MTPPIDLTRYFLCLKVLLIMTLAGAVPCMAQTTCTPSTIWLEDFTGLADGTSVDNGTTAWARGYTAKSGANFDVRSSRFSAHLLAGGVATWASQVINISSSMNVTFSVDLSSTGDFDIGEDYLKVYYKLNGGSEILLSTQNGPVSTATVTSPVLNGSTVQIIVRAYNTGDSEYYYFDNIKVKGSAATTAWLENFTGLADGTSVDNGATAWSRTYAALSGANFDVRSSRFSGHLLAGGTAVWTSQSINISSYANVTFSVDVSSAGDFESGEDYLKVYYKLNGGSEVLVSAEDAAVGVTGITSPVLSGSTLQVIIKAYNTGDNEYYYFDNIRVMGITPLATATGGTLNCSPSITIASGPSASGLTYSWTGPNSFTSTVQNPSVSTAGTYTVTVTNPANGCKSQATATVAQGNTTPPDLLVWSSGILTNLSTSSELSASSTTANTTFTWNGFAADDPAIMVSNPGTYSVTAKNTTNGCTTVGSINLLQVPNAIWYEDFDNLPHGVTYHAGQAGWDGESSDIGGYFKVTRIKYEGTDLDKEVVWVSENINISYFTNVGIRINLASEGGLESGDYIKVFYRLDGGPETLLQNGEQYGAFNPVMATVTGLSGSRVKIIVRTYNTASDEKYSFDNVIVYGDQVTLPANVVWSETFNNVPDFTTGTSKWTLDVSNTDISNVGYFEPRQGRLLARDIGGVAIWKSQEINIASYPSVSISADLHGFGVLDADEDYIRAYYKLNGGSEVLIGSIAGVPSIPVTVTTGNISGNKVQIILKTFNDIENERYTIDNIFVRANVPVLAITGITGGTLTCSTTAVNLDVTTNVSSATYAWSGPNGFTSAVKNPSVTAPGNYTVTVTAGGETATASVTVQQNVAGPVAVTATPVGALTCIVTTVNVVGATETGDVTYSWAGPEGFTSTLKEPFVTKPGTYVLTVRRNDNGCTATASATVLRQDTPPANVTAISSAVLTCTNMSTQLSGNSSTGGVSYRWAGPEGYQSNEQFAVTTIDGTYTLTVTDPANGCTTSVDVVVQKNRITPADVQASVSGEITCAESSITLAGATSTTGVTYGWNGPDGFTAAGQATEVSAAGLYTLTVTHTASGCSSSIPNIIVMENTTAPEGVTASASSDLTCTATDVTLTGTSTTSGVTYYWSGPDNFASALPNPIISTPGHYSLQVLDPSNGCVSVTGVEVLRNISVPAEVQAGVSGALTCSTLSVTLEATSTTSNVHYQWSGPGNFSSTEQRPATSVEGDYRVIVSHPLSGCTTTANVTVSKNITPPGISVSNTSGTTVLTCYVTPLLFTGGSSTPGTTFHWSSTNGYESNTAVAVVTQPGIYTFTVTGANGCTVSRSRTVTQNLVLPVATAAVSGSINCNNDPVMLTGTSSASQVTFLWTGPDDYTSTDQNPTVTVAGEYTFTVITPGGCQGTSSVTVLHDACAAGSSSARTASGTVAELRTASSSVYPNPVAGEGTLEWVARQEGEAVIEVYSMTNVKISTLRIHAAQAGETHRIRFSSDDYAPGAYIYRIVYRGGQEQGKFIVL